MLDSKDTLLISIYALAQDRSKPLSLEKVLELAKIELEINPPSPPSHIHTGTALFYANHYMSVMLEARLYDFFPFSHLKESMLWSSSGSGSSRQGTALQWVARQLLAGIAPDSVIKAANSQYAENGYDALEISKVTGVEVEDIVKITEDYELWPHDKLPADFRNRLLFDDAAAAFHTGSSSALVHRFRHNKVIDPDYDPTSIDLSKDRFATSNMKRANKRLEIKRAMILSGDGPISMPFTYCRAATDHVLDADRQYIGTFEPAGFGSAKPNIEAIRTNLRLLENFKSPAALCVAIDRLGKARSWQSNEDKALDLGMALEIVLMHENGNNNDGNAEITYKVSSRAAWLIGKTPADRKEVFEKAKKLYGHRSSAAHSGRLKKESEFISPEANAFVTRVLSQILQRGGFPVWRDLVLGIERLSEVLPPSSEEACS